MTAPTEEYQGDDIKKIWEIIDNIKVAEALVRNPWPCSGGSDPGPDTPGSGVVWP